MMVEVSAKAGVVSDKPAASVMSAAVPAARTDRPPWNFPGLLFFTASGAVAEHA